MKNDSLDVSEETFPTLSIAYMRRTGPYGPENHQLMAHFKAWVSGAGLWTDRAVILGIALDDARSTPPEAQRYDVGLIVPPSFQSPGRDVALRTLEGGRYASVRLPHTAEALQWAWSCALPALAARYPLDPGRPVLERYARAMIDAGFCELCIPMRPC